MFSASDRRKKRFYAEARAVPADQGYAVALDGKAIRTPMGLPLTLPALALAEAVAAEWDAQEASIEPASMPLMQLACTALDRIRTEREAIIDQLVAYGASDLVCYRAVAPADLVRRQALVWQPVLDWAAAAFGVGLSVTTGVIPVEQPAASLAKLRKVIAAYDDFRLSALQNSVAAMGSLLLGLALVEGTLSPEDAFAASQLDESYQIALWGEDAEAALARDALRKDIAYTKIFLELYARQRPY